MKKIILLTPLIVVALALAFAFPRVLFAHASVVACAPHIGSNISRPPAQIVCLFDQPLYADKLELQVIAPNGQRVDKHDTRPFENDTFSAIVSLDTPKMTDGIYQVNWRVTNTLDDSETSGTVQFGVNTIVPPTPTVLLQGQVIVTPSAQTAPVNNAPGELISRFLIAAGVIVLVAMGVLFWRMRARGDVQEKL